MQRYKTIAFGYNNVDIIKLLPTGQQDPKNLAMIEKELQIISHLVDSIGEQENIKPFINYILGEETRGFRKLYLCYVITILDKKKKQFGYDIGRLCMAILNSIPNRKPLFDIIKEYSQLLYYDLHELYHCFSLKKSPDKLGSIRLSIIEILRLTVRFDNGFAVKIPSKIWTDIVYSFFTLRKNILYHNIVYEIVMISFSLKQDMLHLKIIIDNNVIEKLYDIIKEAQFARDTHQPFHYKDQLVIANLWVTLISESQFDVGLPMFNEQLCQSEAWNKVLLSKGDKRMLKQPSIAIPLSFRQRK